MSVDRSCADSTLRARKPDSPAWDAWGVADLSLPEAALVDTEVSQLTAAFTEEAPDDDEGFLDAVDDLGEKIRPRALLAADGRTLFARRRRNPVRSLRYSPYSDIAVDAEQLRGIDLRGPIDFGVDVVDLEADPHRSTLEYVSAIVGILAEYNEVTAPGDELRSLAEVVTTARFRSGMPTQAIGDSSGLAELIEHTVTDIANALTDRANAALSSMMPDAPRLLLSITPLAQRFSAPPVTWTANGLAIESLSRAEQQWAVRVINEAIYAHARTLAPPATPLRAAITLIDEPESALHRSAESHMARSLQERAADPRHLVIAATHSPELLDAPAAHLIEVQRKAGRFQRSRVQTLDFSDRTALHRLGLSPSDLLRWPRVILLVEGVHDQTVLDAFVGDRLRAARVDVLPIHGARNLPGSIDSQVLFTHTRAHLIALLDKQRGDELGAVWEEAQAVAAAGNLTLATDIVVQGITDQTDESRFLKSLAHPGARKGSRRTHQPIWFGARRRDRLPASPAVRPPRIELG